MTPAKTTTPSPLPKVLPTPRMHTLGMATLGITLAAWSFGPTLSARVTTYPLVSAFVRMVGAATLQWLLVLVAGIAPSREMLKRAFVPGALFCLNNVLFFVAIRNANVASATLLTSLQPVVVLFVAKPLFGEVIRLWQVICTTVALGGAALAVLGANAAGRSQPTSWLGGLAAIGSMFAFCGYFLLSKHANSRPGEVPPHPLTYITAVITGSAITSVPFVLLSGHVDQVAHLTSSQLKALSLVVVVPSIGHIALMFTHRHVAASLSSLVLLIQPISSALVAWWMLDQKLVGAQIIGGVIVIASIAAVTLRKQPSHDTAPDDSLLDVH